MASHIHRQYSGITKTEKPAWILCFAVAVLSFSYPFTTIILQQLGAPVSTFNIFIKATFAGAFVLAFFLGVRRFRPMHMGYMAIVLFLSIYAVRLLYDTLILGLRIGNYTSTFYTLSYFFFLTFIPILVLGFIFRKCDIEPLEKTIFATLLLTCVVQTVYVMLGGEVDQDRIFTGRVEIAGGAEGVALLGPIHIGVSGACLAAMSLARLVYGSRGGMTLVVLLTLTALGLINIVFSGSRGPMLGILVAIILLLASIFLPRNKNSKLNALGSLLVVSLPIFLAILISSVETGSVFLFDRLFLFFEERSTGVKEARDYLFLNAWEDFKDAPVLGRSFVLSVDSNLPHNLPLEVLMATGVVGATFFTLAILFAFESFRRIIIGIHGPSSISIAIGAVPVLVLGLTSGSIAEGPTLWLMVAVISLIGIVGTKRVSSDLGNAMSAPRTDQRNALQR